MKWTYGTMIIPDPYFGELIIGIRTAEDGTRQTTDGSQQLWDKIYDEDDIWLVPKPNRDEIIKGWNEAAAMWQKQPLKRAEWWDIEPVQGSPAWAAWMASSK